MSARRSKLVEGLPEGLHARVLPQIDRVRRLEAMLERWRLRDVSQEPDWDVDDVERIALRVPSS